MHVVAQPRSEPHYIIALLDYVNALLIDQVRFLMIINKDESDFRGGGGEDVVR